MSHFFLFLNVRWIGPFFRYSPSYTASRCNTWQHFHSSILQHVAMQCYHCYHFSNLRHDSFCEVWICNTLQHTATHCNTLRHAATRCNTLQHAAKCCNTLQNAARCCNALHHIAPHYNTLSHTSTHCNAQQHTATHCKSQ